MSQVPHPPDPELSCWKQERIPSLSSVPISEDSREVNQDFLSFHKVPCSGFFLLDRRRNAHLRERLAQVPPCKAVTTAPLSGSNVHGASFAFEQVSRRMAEFRLLYLRANRLEKWEVFQADDALSAVHFAARKPSADMMELWSEEGKIAIFRPVGTHHAA